MNPVRSFLFVPADRASWIEKATACGADALILDLESSVLPAQKTHAREIVRSKLEWLAEQGQRTWVRINRSPHLYDFTDIMAAVGPHTEGLVLPKPCGPEDIDTVSSMVSEAEYRKGLPVGRTRLMPVLMTSRALQLSYEIAQRERVAAIVGAAAKDAELARDLDTVWTAEGEEFLYIKSRVVMAARAAGKIPVGGLWQQVHDLDGLRTAALRDRALGMGGQLLIHPSNVPVVNAVFMPSPEQLAYYEGLLAAVEKARIQGRASAVYRGDHVGLAHVETARSALALARGGRRLPGAGQAR